MQFMIPPRNHAAFYSGLDAGVEVAQQLGCPRMVVGSGTGFGGRKRQDQLDELIEIFTRGVAHIEGSGITLVLEPVNVRVDHPGSLLDRTAEAVYVARGVNSPYFGVLYDLYHSTVEGEDVAAELANAGDLIKYVQIADAPGRGEPGSGSIDWHARLADLREQRLRRPHRARVLPDHRLGEVRAAHPGTGGGMRERSPVSRLPSTSPSSAAARRQRRTRGSSARKRPVPPSPCSRWARRSAIRPGRT